MFKYTEKIWSWFVGKSLQAKFYAMMAASHFFHFFWSILHGVNRGLLWIEHKLYQAASYFFHK